jgi:hypothetical protein
MVEAHTVLNLVIGNPASGISFPNLFSLVFNLHTTHRAICAAVVTRARVGTLAPFVIHAKGEDVGVFFDTPGLMPCLLQEGLEVQALEKHVLMGLRTLLQSETTGRRTYLFPGVLDALVHTAFSGTSAMSRELGLLVLSCATDVDENKRDMLLREGLVDSLVAVVEQAHAVSVFRDHTPPRACAMRTLRLLCVNRTTAKCQSENVNGWWPVRGLSRSCSA